MRVQILSCTYANIQGLMKLFLVIVFTTIVSLPVFAKKSCQNYFGIQTSAARSRLAKGLSSSPALRHTYEDQLREQNLIRAKKKQTVWGKISSYFTGRKTHTEMAERYGQDWEKTLSGDFVDATQTALDGAALKTISSRIQKNAFVDLEANVELATRDILGFLNDVQDLYGLNLFMLWRTNTSQILKAITERHSGIRELVIDRVDNSDFKSLVKLRELRSLDISNSMIGRSGSLFYLNKLFNSHLSELRSNLRYVTVDGIIQFLKWTKEEIEIKGKRVIRNPHFKKLILPYLDSTEYIQIRKVARELGITLQYQGVHRNPYFSGDYADVMDGDSNNSMPHGVDPKRWENSIRLAYIDTPELKVTSEQAAKESKSEAEARMRVGLAARAFSFYHKKHAQDEILIDTNSKDRSGRPVVVDFLFVDGRWIDLAQELYLNGLGIRYEYTGQSREDNMGSEFSWLAHYKQFKPLIDPWYEVHVKIEEDGQKKKK